MKTIQVSTIITSLSAKVDGSVRLSMVTPELSSEEKAELFNLQNQNTETTIKPIDLVSPPVMKIEKELGQKTPSQRLRAILFVAWKQAGEHGDFDFFYKQQIESFIDSVKVRLD